MPRFLEVQKSPNAAVARGRLVAHAIDRHTSALGIVRLGAVIAVPAFLTVALANTSVVALIGLFLAGMAVGPIEPTVFRLVSLGHALESRGRALSRVTAIAYVGYLSGPVALGAIVQATGWSVMWGTVTLAALAVLALSVLVGTLEP